MTAFNDNGTNKDVNMTKAKSEEAKRLSLENTYDTLIKGYMLKATSTENETRYNCKECGKQMTNKSNLNAHIRAIHEGIKHPCGQCQYEATSKGHLAQHRRAVHEGIKYPCGQCQHEATSKGDLARHRRAVHDGIKSL